MFRLVAAYTFDFAFISTVSVVISTSVQNCLMSWGRKAILPPRGKFACSNPHWLDSFAFSSLVSVCHTWLPIFMTILRRIRSRKA